MNQPPRPRAFRLPASDVPPAPEAPEIAHQPDAFAVAAPDRAEVAIEIAQAAPARGIGWSGLFWSALGGLLSLASGLWLTQLVEGLFAHSLVAGWAGVVLAALAVLSALVLFAREVLAISRQRRIARLHKALAEARAGDDRDAARLLLPDLAALYAARPGTAAARAEIARLSGEIIDGRDLIDLAERELLHPLDLQVRRAIAKAAKAVSVVTTVSPRAIFDVIFVAAQAVYLMRRIAEIYGGRPGLLGFFKLARSVATHIAITGGMAAGDSLVQQLVGHGIAARLSARLGEGVLNGLLTARVGLSAMSVCRPMPFAVAPAPGVKDVVPELFSGKLAG